MLKTIYMWCITGWCGAGADHYEPLIANPLPLISQDKAAVVLWDASIARFCGAELGCVLVFSSWTLLAHYRRGQLLILFLYYFLNMIQFGSMLTLTNPLRCFCIGIGSLKWWEISRSRFRLLSFWRSWLLWSESCFLFSFLFFFWPF